ncbi:uncharacterized protein LOC134945731 isoform X1 [Pseudophryne corroboree]|uniref:uncharacterized protein LOC134945731 isoform X1 n=1 Tax=Pseudophryne corroboree TaxID=495146 RepID=UPI003082164D
MTRLANPITHCLSNPLFCPLLPPLSLSPSLLHLILSPLLCLPPYPSSVSPLQFTSAPSHHLYHTTQPCSLPPLPVSSPLLHQYQTALPPCLTHAVSLPSQGPSTIITPSLSFPSKLLLPQRYSNPDNLIHISPTNSYPLSCALWNARSICNKLAPTHDLFISNSLHLLAITETWITPYDTTSPAALSAGGLTFSHTPRPGGRHGGGVGILLPSSYTYQLIPPEPSLTFSTFEVHAIRLYQPTNLRVAVVYRPPGISSKFLDIFASWLPHFLSSDIPSIILGDFNIPIDNPTKSPASKLLNLTSSLGLSQWTTSPSHVNGSSLDLVFTHRCDISDFSNSPFPSLTTTCSLSTYLSLLPHLSLLRLPPRSVTLRLLTPHPYPPCLTPFSLLFSLSHMP